MWMLNPPARTSSVTAWTNWKNQLDQCVIDKPDTQSELGVHIDYANRMINILNADPDAPMNIGLSDSELHADDAESFTGVVYKAFPERKLLWIQCDDGHSIIGCFDRIGDEALSFAPKTQVRGNRTRTLHKVINLHHKAS